LSFKYSPKVSQSIWAAGHDVPFALTETDYLPTDIQAAPATAEVEAIIIMACIFDGYKISVQNAYPLISGCCSQLTFRDHPQLGKVASFERFPGEPMYRKLRGEDLVHQLKYGAGIWHGESLVSDWLRRDDLPRARFVKHYQ